MNTHRTIARNVIWNWAGTLTDMVVGFVLVRYLLMYLGDTRYGWWLIIAALTSYFSYFDLGVRSSVGRNIAYHRARGDQGQVNAIVSTAFVFLGLVAAVVLTATFALPALFFAWYDVAPEEQASVRLALLLVGGNLALTFPLSLFDAVLWAYQRFDIHNIVDIPLSLLRGGLSLVLVAVDGGLVALASVVVLTSLAAAVLKASASFRTDPRLRINPRRATRAAAREVFSYGAWQFLLAIGRKITGQLAVPIIGARFGPAFAPPQSVAARLPGYAEQLVTAGAGVLTPVATGLHATDESEKQRRLFLEGGKYCTALALFFVVLFVCIGEPLITLWLHRELEGVGLLLTILTVGELLPLSQWISYSVVLAMGRHRELALLAVRENVLVLGLVFAPLASLSVPGVCLALAVAGTLCRGLLQLLYTCRLMDVSLWAYTGRVFVPAVVTAAPPAALLATVQLWHVPDTWLEFLVHAGVYGLAYVVMGAFVLVGREQAWELVDRLRQGIWQLRYGTH